MTAVAERAPAPMLDVETTLERLAGDEELFGEIAQILIATAPGQLESIAAALAAQNLKSAYEEAHSLKGAVAAFEAPEVFNLVASVEKLARAGDAPASNSAFAAAKPMVEALLGELAQFTPAQ